jgi:hypothetical protein
MPVHEDFDSFLPLQQSPVYAEALARLGAVPRWVDLGCGKALVIERGRLRMVMRGPVWSDGCLAPDRRKALRGLARWPGVTIATPEEDIRGFGLIPLVTPLHHTVWQLGPGLRAGMARNWRNHLSRAERSAVRITRGDGATLDQLIVAEGHQRAQAALSGAARGLHPGPVRRLPAALGMAQVGAMQAGWRFVVHGTSASYHLAGGLMRRGRRGCIT